MQGWKTWIAVIAMILYAVAYEGLFNSNWVKAMEIIIAAIALIGIGHKLDKVKS